MREDCSLTLRVTPVRDHDSCVGVKTGARPICLCVNARRTSINSHDAAPKFKGIKPTISNTIALLHFFSSSCQIRAEKKKSLPTRGRSILLRLVYRHIPVSSFPSLALVSLFKHTHLSLWQALTEEFAISLGGELQDTQITQGRIYGICIIREVKITRYLDERQLDN